MAKNSYHDGTGKCPLKLAMSKGHDDEDNYCKADCMLFYKGECSIGQIGNNMSDTARELHTLNSVMLGLTAGLQALYNQNEKKGEK